MSEKTTWLVVRVILGIVVLLFTLYGFFIKQECDIDAVYLWCRLHPMSILQVVGVIGFYGGAFALSGIWQKWITLYNEENNTKWNWIFCAAIFVSLVLIWVG